MQHCTLHTVCNYSQFCASTLFFVEDSDDDIAEGHLITILPKVPQSQINTAIPKVTGKSYLKSVLLS